MSAIKMKLNFEAIQILMEEFQEIGSKVDLTKMIRILCKILFWIEEECHTKETIKDVTEHSTRDKDPQVEELSFSQSKESVEDVFDPEEKFQDPEGPNPVTRDDFKAIQTETEAVKLQ